MFPYQKSTPLWSKEELRRMFSPRWTMNELAKMTPPQRKAAVQEMAGWTNSTKKQRSKNKRKQKKTR